MRLQLLRGADDQFVHQLALVFDDQAHGVTDFDGEVIGGETHFVRHGDGHGALHRFGVAGNAPVFLLFDHGRVGWGVALMGKSGERQCQ